MVIKSHVRGTSDDFKVLRVIDEDGRVKPRTEANLFVSKAERKMAPTLMEHDAEIRGRVRRC